MKQVSIAVACILICGCRSEAPLTPLDSDLTSRATSGLGASIWDLQRASLRTQANSRRSEATAYLTIFLVGPKSLWGTLSVPGSRILETEISFLTRRVGSNNEGVLVQVLLAEGRWTDWLSFSYKSGGAVFSGRAKRVAEDPSFYRYVSTSLSLGPKLRERPKVTSRPCQHGDTAGNIVALSYGGDRVTCYLLAP